MCSSGVCKLHFSKVLLWVSFGGFLPPVSPFPVSQKLFIPPGRAVLTPVSLCLQQQTEWQRYLRQSLEVVAKVMELLPTHAFSTLVSPSQAQSATWNEHQLL